MRVRSLPLIAVVAIACSPLLAASGSTPAPYPGLPPGDGFQWGGVVQRGYTRVAASKLAVEIPANVVTADINTGVVINPDQTRTLTNTNKVYFVSPAGSRRPYGELPPLRVRALAFGFVPVTATVHLAQRRLADGTPEPLVLRVKETTRRVPAPPVTALEGVDTTLVLDLRIDDLRIDGHAVDVGAGCTTVRPVAAALTSRSHPYLLPAERAVDSPDFYRTYFTTAVGGRIDGTVTIPPFARCGRGEDVSPLLTATVSGAGNPMRLQVGPANCQAAFADSQKGIPPGGGQEFSRCFNDSAPSAAAKTAYDELTAAVVTPPRP